MEFTGFPVAALDFYDDLEMDNTRSFWEKHKQVYLDDVRGPMTALTAALAPEFGDAKVFRPHRDVRFAKDKTPFKEHQGAFVAVGEATGYYVQVSARGVRTAAGFYQASSQRLGWIRAAMADERTGTELERLLDDLRGRGFEIEGDRLKTSPRGYDATHPRIDLLRHRSLSAVHPYGFDDVIHSPDLVEAVRADWQALRPVVEWISAAAGD
ncbi:DUF2461 domain-containing protein [Nocardioides pacificus]